MPPTGPEAKALFGGAAAKAELWAEAFAANIAKFQLIYLLLLSCIYFIVTSFHAAHKLFWFDERFTIYLSREPSVSAFWEAVRNGTDLNPPLGYLVTAISERVLGPGHVTSRVPEMIGFWIFCLCLYRFVSLRSSPLAGFAAMIFPWVTQAYWYSYEARPHALVLGFCGVALVCWQAATTENNRAGKNRTWALLGLTASLAAALLSHSFAALLFIPIALAELVRTYISKKVDWPIWVALAASSSTILFSLSLLRNAKKGLAGIGYYHPSFAFVASYNFLLAPSLFVLAAAFFLLSLDRLLPVPAVAKSDRPAFRAIPHEVALALALVAAPFFGVVLARVAGGPFVQRYALSAIAGCAYFVGVASAKSRKITGLCLVGILLFGFAKQTAEFVSNRRIIEPTTNHVLKATRGSNPLEQYSLLDSRVGGDLPIVILDDLDFVQLDYYAPPALSNRLWYVMWHENDLIGGAALVLNRWIGRKMKLADASTFLASHPQFLIYASGPRNGSLSDFLGKGANLQVRAVSEDEFLIEANVH